MNVNHPALLALLSTPIDYAGLFPPAAQSQHKRQQSVYLARAYNGNSRIEVLDRRLIMVSHG